MRHRAHSNSKETNILNTNTQITNDQITNAGTFQAFKELKLPHFLGSALERMQFLYPTPVQAATIPVALLGKDVLGTAQTGTGKTAAFGVPVLAALHGNPKIQALILAPTRELAAQIHGVLRQMSSGTKLHGTLVVGGESFSRQADAFYRGTDYIVATPGRLNDHLQERTVSLKDVGILVLDEVDRMLDMGFLPQIQQVVKHVPAQRQTLLFSATLPPEMKKVVGAFLTEPVRVEIGRMFEPLAQVKEETISTRRDGQASLLLKALGEREGKVLVFVRTKSRADSLALLLARERFDAVCLHGGRSQGQRKQALARFRAGTHRIMVATDLAGRGIDVTDIQHVINFDLPGTREDYIHRIGRTARAGKNGSALSFRSPEDTDAPQILSGEKRPPRTVFRSQPRRGRRR